ncbi:CcmD family protein [Solitalea sp. MAHUQ-68]|uniref:CcmD family protein n=1 Tax=Solitalea agri TaxID=2953739 RepID=A0A9X2JDY6_9SPHI|nr:CcmD family protein [Solitalea agri]MCO4294159.1 CcmD family protein [Solitalea agri]
MKKYILSLVLILVSIASFAQNNGTVEMADEMRGSGKIYVVIGVMTIIFIGIAFYLFSIDKKLTKLEKDHNQLSK